MSDAAAVLINITLATATLAAGAALADVSTESVGAPLASSASTMCVCGPRPRRAAGQCLRGSRRNLLAFSLRV